MKYNLSILKNKKIGFQNVPNKPNVSFTVINTKSTKNNVIFITTFGRCEIDNEMFLHMKIEEKDNIFWFIYDPSIISGLFGFTMFDTYGFPIELSNEILNNKIDITGYEICRKLQKGISSGTFKNQSAFN